MNLPPFVTANPFMSGGLLVAVGGSVMNYLKAIPPRLSTFFTQTFSVSLTVTDDTAGFGWLKMWISDNPKFARKRRLDLHTPYIGSDYFPRYSIAPGVHYFWYQNRPTSINLNRSEEKSGGSGYHSNSSKRTESFVIRILGRNRKVLENLIQEAREKALSYKSTEPKIYFWNDGDWTETQKKLRSLSSVILPNGMKEQVLEDMRRFSQKEDWYKDLGIPYHRGYLFYGKPGGGKTALITGLANEMRACIYFLKLNDMSDKTLSEALQEVRTGGIIVMEDADCVVPRRRKEKTDGKEDSESDGMNPLRGVSLSGLLNVLDGLQAPHGVFYIMTTNNLSALDPALLRPGRMDIRLDFDVCGKPEAAKLARRFFPAMSEAESLALVENIPAGSMAEYQESFIQMLHPMSRGDK